MTNFEQEIDRFFLSYSQAFDNFDASQIADHFYFPSIVITKAKAVSFSKHADGLANFSKLVAHHQKLGYSRAEIKSRTIHPIASTILLVSVVWVFYRADDSIIYEFETIYTLCNYEERWQITAVLAP